MLFLFKLSPFLPQARRGETANTGIFSYPGKWDNEFNPKRTIPHHFTVSPSQTNEVSMMRTTAGMSYIEDGQLGCQAVELPYKGGELSMVVILPDEITGLQVG